MKVLADNNTELDAEVSIGNHDEFFGLFLESRSGSYSKNPRNSDYFDALEMILKRLHEAKIRELRIFVCSKRWKNRKIEDSEILLDGKKVVLSMDYVVLRKSIGRAQAELKEDQSSKGGNSTKRIFITGEVDENLWRAVVRNSLLTNISQEGGFFEDEPNELTFWEGREVFRLHRMKERNRELVNAAKKERAKIDPFLRCQICEFSFIESYGEIGRDFIEAHHSVPISEILEQTEVKIGDLVMVCANCHRMLHRTRPWLTIAELKSKVIK